jgi:hypothetical protein
MNTNRTNKTFPRSHVDGLVGLHATEHKTHTQTQESVGAGVRVSKGVIDHMHNGRKETPFAHWLGIQATINGMRGEIAPFSKSTASGNQHMQPMCSL